MHNDSHDDDNILCLPPINKVVPRTFTGAFVLSTIAKIISWIIPKQMFDVASHPMFVQFLIRFELLLLCWVAHVRLSKSLERYFGGQIPSEISKSTIPSIISNYYLLITASQFHLPFYSSRLLPNTFALMLVTNAYAEWFNNKPRRTAILLVFTTAIFRCDVLLLLFTIGLTLLIRRELSIGQAIATGIVTGVCSLLLTVPLDSLLWGRLIWPEFEVLFFNTVDNRSSEWGTMAWHWYFSRALPKGMLLTALLIPLSFLKLPEFVSRWTSTQRQLVWKERQFSVLFDLRLLHFVIPVLGFVALYSSLPHKEIRFIFPALPMLNICAAYGMSRLHLVAFPIDNERKGKSKEEKATYNYWVTTVMYICGIGSVACTMLGSFLFVMLSKENYPGGVALNRLRYHLETSVPLQPPIAPTKELPSSSLDITRNVLEDRQRKWQNVHVHIDVAAAMTGVSLFGQRYASHRHVSGEVYGPFSIDKSGYEKENNLRGAHGKYTHLLTEKETVKGYHAIITVPGHPRFNIRNLRIETRDAIYILERD